LIRLTDAMHDAEYVMVDGVIFETEYTRVADEYTVADDVVLEARHGEDEFALTRGDVDAAQWVDDGTYRLPSGAMLRLLTGATLH
jgi:hypothetical protein